MSGNKRSSLFIKQQMMTVVEGKTVQTGKEYKNTQVIPLEEKPEPLHVIDDQLRSFFDIYQPQPAQEDCNQFACTIFLAQGTFLFLAHVETKHIPLPFSTSCTAVKVNNQSSAQVSKRDPEQERLRFKSITPREQVTLTDVETLQCLPVGEWTVNKINVD